jgi:predicted transcriptional regulator
LRLIYRAIEQLTPLHICQIHLVRVILEKNRLGSFKYLGQVSNIRISEMVYLLQVRVEHHNIALNTLEYQKLRNTT